jgi:hypothetical protein
MVIGGVALQKRDDQPNIYNFISGTDSLVEKNVYFFMIRMKILIFLPLKAHRDNCHVQ